MKRKNVNVIISQQQDNEKEKENGNEISKLIKAFPKDIAATSIRRRVHYLEGVTRLLLENLLLD